MAKTQKRYSPDDVDPLLVRARAGELDARNELLNRFEPLISGLVGVCTTGRVFYRSSYQKTFLKLFSKEGTPLQNTAAILKMRLGKYSKGELISAGHMAVLKAIEDTDTNLASTIVFKFKDIITVMIKDPDFLTGNWEVKSVSLTQNNLENEVAFNDFLEGLDEEEFLLADLLMDGLGSSTLNAQQKVAFNRLKRKLAIYMELRPEK